MRKSLITLLCLTALNIVWASGSINITWQCSDIPLRAALDSLSQISSACFIYDDDIVDGKTCTCRFDNLALDQCIDQLIKPSHISVKRVTPVTYILYQNQERILFGHVYDAHQNTPLAGANVFIPGTSIGVETGVTGTFHLTIPIETESLTIRYMGYESQTIRLLDSPDGLHIPMNPMVIPMQPVEAVAHGVSSLPPARQEAFQQNQNLLGKANLPFVQGPLQSSLPDVSYKIGSFIDPKKGVVYYKYEVVDFPQAIQQNDERNKHIDLGQLHENLILVDGLRFYKLQHISPVPGPYAELFGREWLHEGEFYCGGFHVNYDDALNTILTLHSQSLDQPSYTGEVSLQSFGQSLFLATAVPNRYSVMIQAKHFDSHFLPQPVQVERNLNPKSNNFQAQWTYQVSQEHSLNAFFLRSLDRCSYSPIEQTYQVEDTQIIEGSEMACTNTVHTKKNNGFTYSSTLASVGSDFLTQDKKGKIRLSYYENIWKDRLQSEYNIFSTFFIDNRYLSDYNMQNISNVQLREQILESDFNLEMNVTENWKRQTGFTYRYYRYNKASEWEQPMVWRTNIPLVQNDDYEFDLVHPVQTLEQEDTGSEHQDLKGARLSGYYLESFRFWQHYQLIAGLRLNVCTLTQSNTLNPRIKMQYFPNPQTLVQFAWGVYSDLPLIYALDWSDPNPSTLKNQKAFHSVLSADFQISPTISGLVEGYYKKLEDLTPINRTGNGNLAFVSDSPRREGTTMGLRAGLVLTHSLFTMEGLYELKKSEEQIPELTLTHPRFDDQRHTVSFNLSTRLNHSLILDLNVSYGSGYAYAPYTLLETNEWEPTSWHQKRFPPFAQVDLKIEKTVAIGQGILGLDAHLINCFGRKNVSAYYYSINEIGNPTQTPQILYGFLPLFGATYKF